MSGIKFTAYREGGALFPWQSAAQEELARVPSRPKLVTVEVKQPRNPKHLAKYWVICQRVASTSPVLTDAEAVDDFVRLKLRMFKEFKDYDGRVLIRPDSISVESMDQIRFNAFFERAMAALAEHLGISPEELLAGPEGNNGQI